MTFVETDGIIAIEAEHYAEAESGDGGKFEKIPEYGKTLSGMKAYPCDRTFAENEGPKLIYRIYVEEEGNYRILLYTAPANPLNQWDRVEFGLSVNGLNLIRIVECKDYLRQGENEIQIQAVKPGFLLEKLVIVKAEKKLPESYLGPEESYYIY